MTRIARFDPYLGWVTVASTAHPVARLAALKRLFPAATFRIDAAL